MAQLKMSSFTQPKEEEVKEKVSAPSIKDQMIQIAEDRFKLGKDQTNNLFGIDTLGGNIALSFGGPQGVMSQLGLLVYRQTGKTPSNNANSEVRRLLEARASSEPVTRLPIRSGYDAASRLVSIDVGDEDGRAIEVRPGAWTVVDRSKVTFTRTRCTSAMVEPRRVKGESGMRSLFNVGDAEWDFLVNWQALTFISDMAHVMPILEGNPGSAKTSTTKILVDAVDPSKGALNSPPKDQEALELSASGSWVFALENISHVTPDLSDALARLITGAGWRKRVLFSDGDIHIQEMQRIVVINGISITGLRADLLDRSVTIQLNPPSRSDRRTEDDIAAAYAAAKPGHLALLLDILAGAMKVATGNGAEIEYGRMASFEQWLAYCDKFRGTKSLEWYRSRRNSDVVQHVLEDPVAEGLYLVATTHKARSVSGTSREIMTMIPEGKQIPTTAKGMTARLRMLSAGLIEAGWKVEERTFAGSKASARWFVSIPEE